MGLFQKGDVLWVVYGSKGVQMVYKSVERFRTKFGHRGDNPKGVRVSLWTGPVAGVQHFS